MNIKETRELFDAAKAFAVGAKEVMADGKANLRDLPTIMHLWGPLQVAVDGANLVPAELKDLDPEEAKVLLADAVDVIKAIMGIFKPA